MENNIQSNLYKLNIDSVRNRIVKMRQKYSIFLKKLKIRTINKNVLIRNSYFLYDFFENIFIFSTFQFRFRNIKLSIFL